MRNIFFIILIMFSFSSHNSSSFDPVSALESINAWIPKKTIVFIGITVGILYVFRYNILFFIDRKAKERFKPKSIHSDEIVSLLQKTKYAPSIISRLRQQELSQKDKEILDQELIGHYKKSIYEALNHIEPGKRQIWVEEAEDLLTLSKFALLGKYGELNEEVKLFHQCYESNDGLEKGKNGTKYQALNQIKEETKQFSNLGYVQSSGCQYKTPAEVLFIDC